MIKLGILILCLILTNFIIQAFESNPKSDLPDFNVILSAQLRCDDNELKKIPWDKRYRDLWKLAYKTVSIISDVELTEEVRSIKKSKERHRDFKLKYIPYGRIFCGETSELEKHPELVTELPVIEEAFKRPGFFDYVGDDNPVKEVTYLGYMKYRDQPNPPGLDGLSCLVELKDFLADPLKSIDLKKLCKSEKKSKIEFTKKEILRVAEILGKQTASSKIDKKK